VDILVADSTTHRIGELLIRHDEQDIGSLFLLRFERGGAKNTTKSVVTSGFISRTFLF
jgi:hypothetical protein